jgi:O-methyltransferase
MLSKLFEPVRALKDRWKMGSPPHVSSDVRVEEDGDEETIGFVRPYTMTSPERIRALCSATRYIAEADIPGAIVECGVWRGGSMMAVARTLMRLGVQQRELYLFDTFEGMSEPGHYDVAMTGEPATALLERARRTEDDAMWCYAPFERVAEAMSLTDYPTARIHLIRGKVEDTLQMSAPSRIALLRLDTDWYESTRHEMEQLFPRLSRGGVLILDDYGHWQGAKRAIDEYLTKHQVKLLLHRIDYTGRSAVKVFE